MGSETNLVRSSHVLEEVVASVTRGLLFMVPHLLVLLALELKDMTFRLVRIFNPNDSMFPIIRKKSLPLP